MIRPFIRQEHHFGTHDLSGVYLRSVGRPLPYTFVRLRTTGAYTVSNRMRLRSNQCGWDERGARR